MIVQTATEGAPRFVIKQVDHAAFAGRMARAFGNERFEPVAPRELALFAVDNHDYGWKEFDDAPRRDPATGLPYHLPATPREISLLTITRGPEFNEAHHPYCGLLDAMHMYGVYTGRYGVTDTVLVDLMPAEARADFEPVLRRQEAWIEALKQQLAADAETRPLADEEQIMTNYRQLQFFDQLALYFNFSHPEARGKASFARVPVCPGETATVHIRPIGGERYRLDPFPFSEPDVGFHCEGRFMAPVAGDEAELQAIFRAAPVARQAVRLSRF